MEISQFLLNRLRILQVPPALLWTLAVLVVAALAVQLTRVGVDVLVVVVLCVVVIALERTIGDWMGELLGAGWSSIVLAATVAIPVWFAFAEGGAADRFFSAAERAGYHTLYFETSAAPASPNDASPIGAAAPGPTAAVSTARSSRPAGQAATSASSSDIRSASADAEAAPARTRAVTPTVRLEVPEMGATGARIVIRAHVKMDAEPASGIPVAFTINGRALETGVTDPNGVATAVFVPDVPRMYQIRAQLTGSALFRKPAAAAATLHILPAKS